MYASVSQVDPSLQIFRLQLIKRNHEKVFQNQNEKRYFTKVTLNGYQWLFRLG
jgi:hypothetical protein